MHQVGRSFDWPAGRDDVRAHVLITEWARLTPDLNVDALSDILRELHLASSIFCRAEMRGAFAVHTRETEGAIFHVIIRGRGFVTLDDGPVQPFEAGDVVVLPRGSAHIMSSQPTTDAVPISSLARLTADDGLPLVCQGSFGAETSIICGTFTFAPPYGDVVRPLLPKVLCRPADGSTAAWLDSTLRLMASQDTGAPGSHVVLTRLADIMVVQVLRSVMERPPDDAHGWLVALRDKNLGHALQLMHTQPAEKWTAASLARKVGLSRSVFFERFSQAVGQAPASYLLRWRMLRAQQVLQVGATSIAEVAAQVGYASDAAFRKAFKRAVGTTPVAYRNRYRDDAAAPH